MSKPASDRREWGRSRRADVPRSAHGSWTPPPGRPDPVGLLAGQNATRVDWLVPMRHARMQVSPFTFFRGSARIMAADLARTPVSGLEVQLGGDAHLSNFGAYASPERRLVFDANDFDETLRGPWEWDLKRLAASFAVAAQHLGCTAGLTRRVAADVSAAYRQAMWGYAAKTYLETWHDHTVVDDLAADAHISRAELAERLARFQRRARSKTSLQAMRKLTTVVDGHLRIRSDPPVLVPVCDLPADMDPAGTDEVARRAFDDYKETLPDHRRFLLDRYQIVDIAMKVVGVGSVGTRCLIMLLMGRDERDPLFLQGKEAGRSVLEEHLGPSPYANQGRRVVEGQRITQAESDVFLGWTEGREGRDFYVRQLRDWKGTVEVERATPKQLRFYAGLCGRSLARGHARSGDAVAIAGYCGRRDNLDRAVSAFSVAYAAQNAVDFERFRAAIADGTLPVADLATGR